MANTKGDTLVDLAVWLNTVVDCNRVQRPFNDVESLFADFVSVDEPSMTVGKYLLAIRSLATDVQWVEAVILLDRLLQRTGQRLDAFNAHRLLLAAILVSMKLHSEYRRHDLVRSFAASICQQPRELARLERNFLCLLDWEVHVSPDAIHLLTASLPTLWQQAAPDVVPQDLIPLAKDACAA
eukprot:Hpha_TRINITY_DN15824_c0_g1::TRINITY_DN15824_c0_g1_i4::g.189674::m.189674